MATWDEEGRAHSRDLEAPDDYLLIFAGNDLEFNWMRRIRDCKGRCERRRSQGDEITYDLQDTGWQHAWVRVGGSMGSWVRRSPWRDDEGRRRGGGGGSREAGDGDG